MVREEFEIGGGYTGGEIIRRVWDEQRKDWGPWEFFVELHPELLAPGRKILLEFVKEMEERDP